MVGLFLRSGRGETAPAGQLNSTGFHFMIKNLLVGLVGLVALCLATATYAVAARAADTTKIVLIAGHPSHGPGEHEFNAGCKLLCKPGPGARHRARGGHRRLAEG